MAGAVPNLATVAEVARVGMVRAATCRSQQPLAAPVVRSRAAMVVRVPPVATMRQGVIASGEALHSPIR